MQIFSLNKTKRKNLQKESESGWKSMKWEELDQELMLDELSAEELAQISIQEAQMRMQNNINLLAKINNLLLEATNELGKWRIIVEKLKHTKNTIIEQNRALKEILKGEKW
ncbi:hypothetical protein H17ap60334_04892 [Thermosipho africanus H17ap60334]|nr:hypothetical protein H17ap60334_04892 [Thermosipho africanus H17ap60334]